VLIVLGLGIIIASMMGIFNFAHGEFVLLGAFVTYFVASWGWPVWLGMAAAPVAVGAFGIVVERLVIRRFYAAPIIAMLATYALGLVIRETVRGTIGGLYLSVAEPVAGSFSLGNVHFAAWRLCIIVITAGVVLVSYVILSKTSFGLRIRASLENPPLARASGISTSTIYGATFAFGAALAGLAGALIVPIFSLFADLGLRFLIQGFIAVMVGGVGTFLGSIVGASVIGSLSAAMPWIVPPVVADVLIFVLAIAFIKIKPTGLISARGRE
jgi:branched-chain amino acid transport system permease protein